MGALTAATCAVRAFQHLHTSDQSILTPENAFPRHAKASPGDSGGGHSSFTRRGAARMLIEEIRCRILRDAKCQMPAYPRPL